jgi:general secretion pathway protein D
MRGLKWTLAFGAVVIGLAAGPAGFAQEKSRSEREREEALRASILRLLAMKKATGGIVPVGATVPDVVKRQAPIELPTDDGHRIPVGFTERTQEQPVAKQPPAVEQPPAKRPVTDASPQRKEAPSPISRPQTAGGRAVVPPLQPGEGRIDGVPRDFSRIGIDQIGPDQFIVTGATPEQVDAFYKLLDELDRAGGLAEADIDIVELKHAESSQLARLLTQVYTAKGEVRTATGGQAGAPATQQGKVGFIPVAQPNSIVIIGRKADLPDIATHIRQLDNLSKEGEQFKVFKLKLAKASQLAAKLEQFFVRDRTAQQAPGTTGATSANLRLRVEIVADDRTNSLMVFAGPSDMAQAQILIEMFDKGEINSKVEMRYFLLKNATASEIQSLLQNSILQRANAAAATTAPTTPQQPGGQQPGGQFPFGGNQGQNQQAGATSTSATGSVKSASARLQVADRSGAFIESGVLEDITIATDPRANGLLVTAPQESMGLIEELIKQLDSIPNPESKLKILPLRNADATAMLTTLQSFFAQDQAGGQGGFNQGGFGGQNQFNQGQNQGGAQPRNLNIGGGEPRLSLTPLSFSVDQRTNSLLVVGSENDIVAVEALVYVLDNNNARERKNFVYRLNNIPAEEADVTIQNFLSAQANNALTGALGAAASGALTTQQQITQDVVIVADITTNSLIVSASARYFEEILKVIQILDRRPPQVVIQVLIAEVTLQQNDEFGVELGFQGSNLFDRSITTNNILVPGVNFNSTQPLTSPPGVNAGGVGYQAINNFSLGRAGSQGFGGLVFAASSQNVSVLLRALQRQQRLDVLSRPQLQTLDNRDARLLVGQEIPTTTGTIISQVGSTQTTVEPREVGIILLVTPQIGPDGVVVMRVNPQVSSVDTTQSIPISTDASGNVIATAPVFNVTNVETTVVAADGQTVIVGGLIARQRTQDVRKVPILGDIPGLGHLFRTDFSQCVKRELIIVLTPRIVYCDEDVERVKSEEFQRLDWCPPDVWKVHGDVYAPAYPSVEGGDRCVDVLGEEIPANVKLPATGRPRARARMPHHGVHSGEPVMTAPDGVVVPPSDQQTPPPAVSPQPMPQGSQIPNIVPNSIQQQLTPHGAGSTEGKDAPTTPGNIKILPPMQPKGSTQQQGAQQTHWSSDGPLMLPKDQTVKPQAPANKGSLRIVNMGTSRNPSAPMVENQIQRTAGTPNSNATTR